MIPEKEEFTAKYNENKRNKAVSSILGLLNGDNLAKSIGLTFAGKPQITQVDGNSEIHSNANLNPNAAGKKNIFKNLYGRKESNKSLKQEGQHVMEPNRIGIKGTEVNAINPVYNDPSSINDVEHSGKKLNVLQPYSEHPPFMHNNRNVVDDIKLATLRSDFQHGGEIGEEEIAQQQQKENSSNVFNVPTSSVKDFNKDPKQIDLDVGYAVKNKDRYYYD